MGVFDFLRFDKSSETKTEQTRKLVSPDNLPTTPDTVLAKNLEVAGELIKKYNENDIKKLLEEIYKNKLYDSTKIDANLLKIIENFYGKFQTHINGKGIKLEDKLQYQTFYKFLEEVESDSIKTAKEDILKSELLQNSTEKKNVETIFNNIAILRAREQYFKYEYILTQLWIMSYLKTINTSVTEFIDKTLTLVKINETHRNDYTKEMIAKIMAMLKETNTNVDTGAFDFFKHELEKFRQDVENKSKELQTNLKKNTGELHDALANVNIPQNSIQEDLSNQQQDRYPTMYRGGKKKKSQKGGFVRDHSRFPQSFYSL